MVRNLLHFLVSVVACRVLRVARITTRHVLYVLGTYGIKFVLNLPTGPPTITYT